MDVRRRAFVARLGLLLSLACAFGAAVAAEPANPRQTWQLLDYIAVDYAGAVQGGQVVAPAEYAEMREFAATVQTQLSALPATPAQTELIAQADQLVATVEAKAEAHTVAAATTGWPTRCSRAIPSRRCLRHRPTRHGPRRYTGSNAPAATVPRAGVMVRFHFGG